ncbi:MAG: hypothetical protein HZB59_06835 [Ignavibacteriales bacterium]|nr:hypothetical protein [Ignavibacteriales bacterium]
MAKEDKTLQITIQSTRGSKEFSFDKETKISEVITAAISAFSFAPGDRFELVFANKPDEVLKPERPLVSYHIVDGTVLVLTAVGGGV